jgi:hypothetical protein
MLRKETRICDVCGDEVPCGTSYRRGVLTPHAAAALLDVDDPDLVPTWTQLADGRVQLDICLGCFGLMEDPIGTVEVCDGALGVVH